ncbi:MAG TPA: TylF/MycF/NovP-related O-methyltransferase [Thermoleophilaceae bacterium]
MSHDAARSGSGGPGAIKFENTAFAGWQPFREIRAAGPGADVHSLRTAYLDLLKLALCDLTGTTTVSVWRDRKRGMMSRELRGEDLQVRALGVDWPLQGLTMVGLHRLDDLQRCLEAIVADSVAGDVIEAGTWRGGASILMRATLDALGEAGRRVVVADSFQGFPDPDEKQPETGRLAEMDYVAVSLEEVKANFERLGVLDGVEFVRGFFHETVPGLRDRSWALVRLDGDSYEATCLTLQSLYPGLATGGYVIIDDYGALEPCRRAVDEFRERHGIEEPIEQVDWTCARWRRTDSAPIEAIEPPVRSAAGTPASAAAEDPPPRSRVPDMQEVALREQLAERERELQKLRSELGLRDWLRRKLSGGGA